MKTQIRFEALAVMALFVVAGCGAPDSAAQLTASMPDDGALAEHEGELSSNSAARWFPLDEGNEWVFEGSDGTQHTIRSEFADQNLRVVSGLWREPLWLGYSNVNTTNLYGWNDDEAAWSYYVRFGLRNAPWTWTASSGPCDRFDVRREATGARITAPAGTFSDTRTLSFTQRPAPHVRCAPPQVSAITFAAGVGPVEVVLGTQEKLSLISARVGSKRYARKSELEVVVTPDQAVYVNQENTIRCITTPCPTNEVTARATFTLTVTNTSGKTKTYNFVSSKQYDFQILDGNGDIVSGWSDTIRFAGGQTSITLMSGEKRSFSGSMILTDRTHAQLEGAFTVRGTFEPMDATSPLSATARFTVEKR